MLPKTKITFLLTAVFVLSATGALVTVSVLLAQKSKTLIEQAALVSESTANASAYAQLSSQFERTASLREEVSQYVLLENDVIQFVSEIEEAGRSMGLQVQIKKLDLERTEDIYDQLHVDLAFEGRAESSFDFLMLLENLPYANTVHTYSFTYDAQNRNEGTSLVSMSVRIQTE